MRNDNYNIFENMSRFVLKVSEGMAKIVGGSPETEYRCGTVGGTFSRACRTDRIA